MNNRFIRAVFFLAAVGCFSLEWLDVCSAQTKAAWQARCDQALAEVYAMLSPEQEKVLKDLFGR